MIIGIVVLWAGYTVALWGYCTVRGYCVGFRDLLSPGYPRSVLQTTSSSGAATTTA